MQYEISTDNKNDLFPNKSYKNTKITPRFKIGVIMLIINIPIGLLGLGESAIVAPLTKSVFAKKALLYSGVGTYGISWLLLLIGLWLAGKDGYKLSKELTKKYLRLKK